MVLDSVRTFIIWGYSLAVGWQQFQYFQIIGFALLLVGTCIYNEIIVIWFLGKPDKKPQESLEEPINKEQQPLLDGSVNN